MEKVFDVILVLFSRELDCSKEKLYLLFVVIEFRVLVHYIECMCVRLGSLNKKEYIKNEQQICPTYCG